MPTENRSSNTEMVIVPREVIEFAAGLKWHGYKSGTDQKNDQLHALDKLRAILEAPAPQPQPEPIAWMVGTAFWWTKEEAERDAAATGLPIVGLGPMSGVAPAEQHQGEPVILPERKPWNGLLATADNLRGEGWNACLHEIAMLGPLYTHPAQAAAGEDNSPADIDWNHVTELEAENYAMGAQLAERDALLDRLRNHMIAKGVLGEFGPELFQILNIEAPERAARAALSASAEPSTTIWGCRPCQLEQPTDRPCDVCGGKTELAGAKS